MDKKCVSQSVKHVVDCLGSYSKLGQSFHSDYKVSVLDREKASSSLHKLAFEQG